MCGICPSRTRPIGHFVEYAPQRIMGRAALNGLAPRGLEMNLQAGGGSSGNWGGNPPIQG
eukprot:248484-Pyramimonas_sp.AAC.2